MTRWRKANRGREKTKRGWKVRDDAVVAEVERRDLEGTLFSEDRESELLTTTVFAVFDGSESVKSQSGSGERVSR